MINQFLCDMILNHMENCRQFLFQPGDATEVIDSSSKLHLLADTSCQLLSNFYAIDFYILPYIGH